MRERKSPALRVTLSSLEIWTDRTVHRCQQANKFFEWPINVIRHHHNRGIETAPIIDETIEMAKKSGRQPPPASGVLARVRRLMLLACAVRQISREHVQRTVDSVATYPHSIISAFSPAKWRDEADQFFPSRS